MKRAILRQKNRFGIFEETARLKTALMWGQPGPEAIIAQILPKGISCFLEHFSVVEARKEFNAAVEMVRKEGVEVILVKDLYARMIDARKLEPSYNLEELKKELVQKALKFLREYPAGYSGELELIGDILEEDCEKYGERACLVINERLSLQNRLPMANVFYARDQSNVASQAWIWSSMKHEIRQPEVSLYKEILTHAGIVTQTNFKHIIEVAGDGRFEGGDGIANGGFYYVGIGGRTNWEGIKQIAPATLSQGLRLVVFRDGPRDRGKESEMQAMHLDTIWMPSEVNSIVSCDSQTKRRTAFEVVMKNGKVEAIGLGRMDKFMEQQKMEVISLSEEEQKAFAPNFLNLGNGTIVLSIIDESSVDKTKGEKTIEEKLKAKGKRVLNANLQAITKGYGGLHCLTASIKRG